MIELTLSLLIISIILAALTPVISKRAHQMIKVDNSMSVYSKAECEKWFNKDCEACTKSVCLTCEKICSENQYKNTGKCICEDCSLRSVQCIRCGASECKKCNEVFPLLNGVCSDSRCPTGTFSDGLSECKPCPSGKYCMDGLIYNKNSANKDNTSGSIDIPITKYTREFMVAALIGAGGGGGKGNLKMTSANKTESYNYECGSNRQVCTKVYTWQCGYSQSSNGWCGREEGECSSSCCTAGTSPSYSCVRSPYDCRFMTRYKSKTCTGTRVVATQAYSSYGGGGGGSGAVLKSSLAIPQSIIDSAIGGKVNVVAGTGTNGNGGATTVRVINSSGAILWEINANGGKKGVDATAGSAGAGGGGASASSSAAGGSKGSGGGSNTSNSSSNVQGAQGAGAGSSYGAGGKGGTIIVNQNGKQGEIAPAKGANGYAKIDYVQLTR